MAIERDVCGTDLALRGLIDNLRFGLAEHSGKKAFRATPVELQHQAAGRDGAPVTSFVVDSVAVNHHVAVLTRIHCNLEILRESTKYTCAVLYNLP
jgi:hypothetical protein